MRKVLLTLFAVISTATMIADDIIVTKDSQRINAKIEEVGLDVVKYRRSDNLTGPLYTIAKSDIASVIYDNGTTEVFNSTSVETTSITSSSESIENSETLPLLKWESGVYNGVHKMSKEEVYILYQRISPEAYVLYNKGRKNQGWGIALVCVGGVNTILGVINAAGGSAIGYADIALGAGLVGGGAALISAGQKKMRNSVNTYNDKRNSTNISWNITAGQNGIGLAINF